MEVVNELKYCDIMTEEASPGGLLKENVCVCVFVCDRSHSVFGVKYVCVLCRRWVGAVWSPSLSGHI